MAICGVAAEYNPFHRGHLHQLNEIRHLLGEDTRIICVMSGNFVQRGDFAILGKYARAEAAVRCGADLVVELPLTAALSSAEGFAKGAVGVLKAFGCGYMCFGAEDPEKALFVEAAGLLNGISNGGGNGAKNGMSYAENRQTELRSINPEAAELLEHPNNTLGIEYCRFMPPMEPLPIPRKGVTHGSEEITGGFASASRIREKIFSEGLECCGTLLPEESFGVFMRAVERGEAPVRRPDGMLLAILRKMLYEGRLGTGSSDGFDERIRKAVYGASSFREAVRLAQTRRYPLSRIRRELLKLALGLPKLSPEPEYLRVLAIGKHGRELIKGASLPVIVKPVTEKRLGYGDPLKADAFADDFYALAFPDEKRKAGGSHFRRTPAVYL